MLLKGYLTKNTGTVSNNFEKTVTRVYYFFPEGENDRLITDLYATNDFPQIGAALGADAKTSGFILTDISVDKQASDKQNTAMSGEFSWVVTCTYKKGANSSAGGGSFSSSSSSVQVDTDGNAITEETKPWKFPLEEVSITYNKEDLPFRYGWNSETYDFDIPVENSASSQINATTEKYILNISYKYNTQNGIFNNGIWPYKGCIVNDSDFSLFGNTYPSGTVLLKPINSVKKAKYLNKPVTDENGKTEIKIEKDCEYFEHQLEFMIDFDGWKRKLLDVGTFAIFPNNMNTNPAAEQIYHLTLSVIPSSALASPGEKNTQYTRFYDWYGSINDVGRAMLQYQSNSPLSSFSYDAVTEALPLASGKVATDIITGHLPYNVIEFDEYQPVDFNSLGIRTSMY